MRTRQEVLTDQIHPTAIVEPGARLGRNVRIGPYSWIGENVSIGDDTNIGANAVIEGWTSVGRGCTILHSACVGTIPQDLKFCGDRSYVNIGDNNIIREFVTIHRATAKDEQTVIGNNNLLMAYVHIAHNCIIGNNTILANAVNVAGHVEIEDYAGVGGMTPIHQFVRIGAYAYIGGGSRVPQDVPPFVLAAGNPLRVSGVNGVGLRRRGFSAETLSLLRKAFRLVYRSEKNVSQALEAIRAEVPQTPEIERFVRFIESSERGIT